MRRSFLMGGVANSLGKLHQILSTSRLGGRSRRAWWKRVTGARGFAELAGSRSSGEFQSCLTPRMTPRRQKSMTSRLKFAATITSPSNLARPAVGARPPGAGIAHRDPFWRRARQREVDRRLRSIAARLQVHDAKGGRQIAERHAAVFPPAIRRASEQLQRAAVFAQQHSAYRGDELRRDPGMRHVADIVRRPQVAPDDFGPNPPAARPARVHHRRRAAGRRRRAARATTNALRLRSSYGE